MTTLRTRAPRGKQTQPLALRLTPEEVAKADRYASEDSRSRAAFVRLMFLRGMQEYERERRSGA